MTSLITSWKKYKGWVKTKAKSMYLLGGDSNDLIQEGMIGLFKAIRIMTAAETPASAPLRICVYPDRCIPRCRRLPGKKHMPLNTYISL